ncbi:hypothetical protein GCK32_004081 [Trichostrongylus colubriformis]|uniref:Uncharacterized protein n=1 Tax=Trichostrongylus colubriformis TaxID=6319 RepID=A0AAN8IIA5_TRICO
MVLLSVLLIFEEISHGLHVHAFSNDSSCWSAWSPCTVTCISSKPAAKEADFARRWRVWLPKRCPFTTPPNQHTEFKHCSASVPHCLELEEILKPSSRTIYRLSALVLLMALAVIPSVCICCKYSSGFPMIRWERNNQESPRSSMLDAILISEQLENIKSQHAQLENDTPPNPAALDKATS